MDNEQNQTLNTQGTDTVTASEGAAPNQTPATNSSDPASTAAPDTAATSTAAVQDAGAAQEAAVAADADTVAVAGAGADAGASSGTSAEMGHAQQQQPWAGNGAMQQGQMNQSQGQMAGFGQYQGQMMPPQGQNNGFGMHGAPNGFVGQQGNGQMPNGQQGNGQMSNGQQGSGLMGNGQFQNFQGNGSNQMNGQQGQPYPQNMNAYYAQQQQLMQQQMMQQQYQAQQQAMHSQQPHAQGYGPNQNMNNQQANAGKAERGSAHMSQTEKTLAQIEASIAQEKKTQQAQQGGAKAAAAASAGAGVGAAGGAGVGSAAAMMSMGSGAGSAKTSSLIKSGNPLSNNLAFHILMVGIISILLLIPSLFFNYVLDDRQGTESSAIDSIVEPWGYEQTLGDPVLLTHDVRATVVNDEDEDRSNRRIHERSFVAIAKKTEALITPEFEKRMRGNYDATLYKATVVQEGYIDVKSAVEEILSKNPDQQIYINEFKLVIPVKNYKAIDSIKSVSINGREFEVQTINTSDLRGFGVTLDNEVLSEIYAGTGISIDDAFKFDGKAQKRTSQRVVNSDGSVTTIRPDGSRYTKGERIDINSHVPALHNTMDAEKARAEQDNTAVAVVGRITKATDPGMLRFRAEYVLRGSQKLYYRPLGQNTTTEFTGNWKTPSYTGSFLPSEHSSEEKDGINTFKAVYFQNNIATGLPMVSDADRISIYNKSDSYCLDFSGSIRYYTLIDRLTKYVLLFISMTFVTVLACEIVLGRMVSLAQYVVIGAALILFYMVLLAVSEHTSFTFAYTLAAILMSVMISLYLKAALNSKRSAVAVCVMLLAMYAVLFAIVHIEAYALLVGTILLVLMLGIVMYITRRINIKMTF